jgi:peptidoglycan/LPS O-acetylase OafA/YrhL
VDEQRSPAGRLGYVPALDGVRALAIGLVVSWHAFSWPPGGFLGVHVFFVLSGFLITTLLLEEWALKASVSLPHFYLRRALRLLPALFVFLSAYVAAQVARAMLLDVPHFDLVAALRGVVYSGFYVSNVVQAFDGPLAVSVSHLWSLATEEQFYVVWPLALVIALRLGASLRHLEVGLVVAIALIASYRGVLATTDVSHLRLYYAPDTTFDALLVGCLLGVGRASGGFRAALRPRWTARIALAVAALFATPTIVLTSYDDRILYSALLLPFAVASAVLVHTAATSGTALSRLLALPPLVFLGQISYSLYLWHPLVLLVARRDVGLTPIVGVAISIAVATASYAFVERPFLRLKRRDRDVVERSATVYESARFRRVRRERPAVLRRTG